MKQQTISVAVVGFVVFELVGCAQINDTALSLFSSSVSAVAIVDGQRLQGDMKIFPNHTATITLRAVDSGGVLAGPLSNCMGWLRYTAATTGAVDLRCNGGVMAEINTTMLGETRGYGYGKTSSGAVSLAFGLTELESQAHLMPLAGR
jgi:hypothetical protein